MSHWEGFGTLLMATDTSNALPDPVLYVGEVHTVCDGLTPETRVASGTEDDCSRSPRLAEALPDLLVSSMWNLPAVYQLAARYDAMSFQNYVFH
jgi:hypothetical protein